MKRITKRKSLILLTIGLFVIAVTQIFTHFVELADLVKGSCIGIGIGLLLTSVIFGDFKTVR